MNRTLRFAALFAATTLAVGIPHGFVAAAQPTGPQKGSAMPFTGTFTAKSDDMTLTLTLEQRADGTITGTITADGETTRLTGKADGGGGAMSGRTLGDDPAAQADIRMHFENDSLVVEAMAPRPGGGGSVTQRMVFLRRSGATAPAAAKPAPVANAAGAVAAPAVIVNGERLTESFLSGVRRQYGLTIPAGRYWYDAKCGAWGIENGPALGITLAGAAVGGTLRANASNGHSGVYINGRQLHADDIRGFAAIGIPGVPGRYTCDAAGNIRRESDGMFLFNVAERYEAVTAPRRPKGLYHAGAGGYTGSDGQTSYFFDPHGGSVMSGP